jgi:hypothetical protein
MRGTKLAILFAIAIGFSGCEGCGSEEPGNDCGLGDPNQFYPLTDGAWWFHVETKIGDDGGPEEIDKIVYCCAEQPLPRRPGITGFPLVSQKGDDYYHRWQEIRDDGVFRHYDEKFNAAGEPTKITYYCPPKLRIPHEMVQGQVIPDDVHELVLEADGGVLPQECLDLQVDTDCNYDTDATGTCEPAPLVACDKDWELKDIDAEIVVPAGAFTATQFETTEWEGSDDGEIKNWFWSKGVGKIKEQSSENEEEDEVLIEFCIPVGPEPASPPLFPGIAERCP